MTRLLSVYGGYLQPYRAADPLPVANVGIVMDPAPGTSLVGSLNVGQLKLTKAGGVNGVYDAAQYGHWISPAAGTPAILVNTAADATFLNMKVQGTTDVISKLNQNGELARNGSPFMGAGALSMMRNWTCWNPRTGSSASPCASSARVRLRRHGHLAQARG